MPIKSLALSTSARLSAFVWLSTLAALVFACASVADQNISAKTSSGLQLRPQVSWQFLQPEPLDESDAFIASDDPLNFPFHSDSPFPNQEFHLEESESVFVKLPSRHWLYLTYSDEDKSDEEVQHQANKPRVQRKLTGWVSSSPGLAQKATWPEQQNTLPPVTNNRIIEISNPHKDSVSFYLAIGESINNQTFAPLSWMNLDNKNDEDSADERSTDEEKSNTRRLYGSDNNDQDFVHQESVTANQELEFELEKDKVYWIEGVEATGETWSQTQSQLLTWHSQAKIKDDESGIGKSDHSQFLFSRASRKQLLTQNTESSEDLPEDHLKVMRSSVYKADRTMNTKLLLDKQGYVRLQSTDEDWLFSSNYEDYAAPAIKQKLDQEDLSRQLYQQVLATVSAPSHKVATETKKTQHKAQTIPDLQTAETLNSWLSWQNLSPEAHQGIKQQILVTKSVNWNFDSEETPDLSIDNISLPGVQQKQRFNELAPMHSLIWFRPDDAVTNQVQFQILGLDKSNQKDKENTGKTQSSFIIKVDGQEFARFSVFNPPELQQFVRDPRWYIEEVASRKDVPEAAKIKAHIEAHNNAEATGSALLNLPADWHKLEIESASIPTQGQSGENNALVRIRYRKPRHPTLDAPHWQTWLAFENHFDKVAPTLAKHPHWLQFQHYLRTKHKQFKAQTSSPFWQDFIAKSRFPNELAAEEIFNLDFPEGMDDYQRLINNLSQPQVNSWQYWQFILEDLRSAGWSGYANDLSTSLIRFHPNSGIVERAIADYFYQLSLTSNYSQQVSLLSYVAFSNKLNEASTEFMLQSLANLFQQQNRYDYSLFTLGFITESNARSHLIVNAAQHLGYMSLARRFGHETEAPSEASKDLNSVSQTLANARQQLALNSVSRISAAKRVQLYNPELNVRQRNLLLTSESPLTITVSGPTELEFEARIFFDHKKQFDHTERNNSKHDWLAVSFDNQIQLVPIYYSEYRSADLQHPEASVGAAHRFSVFIPESGSLVLQPDNHEIAVNFREVSSHLQNNLVDARCYRDSTWLYQHVDASSEYWWQNSSADSKDNASNDKESLKEARQQKQDDKQRLHKKRQFNCHFSTHIKGAARPDTQNDKVPNSFAVVEAGGTFYPASRRSYQEFLQQLKNFESSPDNPTLTALNRSLHNWTPSSQKHRLLQRVNRYSSWQVQNNPMRVKMFSAFEANTNAPLTPAGYRGRTLYMPFKPQWEKLSENSALNYQLAIAENQRYRLKLMSQQHLFLTHNSVEVEVAINGRFHDVVTLTMGQQTELMLPFSAGPQSLNIRLNNANGQVSVLAQLQFMESSPENDSPPKSQGNLWKTQPQTVRLKLFQAAQQQPLQQFFPEPGWLRIDSFTNQGISKQEFILAEKGMFSWYPEIANQEVIGHRLYHLKLLPADQLMTKNQLTTRQSEHQKNNKKGNTPLVLNLYPSGEHYRPVQNNAVTSELASANTPVESFPEFALLPQKPVPEEQQFVSRPWGMELSLEQRRTPVEDQAQNNRFWQLRVYSQTTEPQQRFFSRYDLAVRNYNSDLSPSIHARYQWWDTSWWDEWNLNAGLRFSAQEGLVDDELAWSGRVNVQAIKQYSLNRRWFNRFSINLWTNLIRSGKDPLQYATAVYSQYKLDHRYGVQLSDTLRYKWHHDFESWLEFTLNSNPFSDNDLVDNGILVLGSRLFYQGFAADVRWRYQSFMADDNRTNSSKDSRLSLALDWFGWEEDAHYRLRLGYDRNLLARENYWFMGVSWNESGARGVQDYMPQSLAFANLRQQEFTIETQENAVTEADAHHDYSQKSEAEF